MKPTNLEAAAPALLAALENLVEWAAYHAQPNTPLLKASIDNARAAIALAKAPEIDPVSGLPFNKD